MYQQGTSCFEAEAFSDGFLNHARNVVFNYPTFIDASHRNDKDFIELLARHTISGTEFDSSERYPPPVCHPGTRFNISARITSWVRPLLTRPHKLVWLYGPAGVGKSAFIQTLAELESDSQESVLGATIFFSRLAERDDPQQVVMTIAYQLAVKYRLYRKFIVDLLTLDPKLVKKSLVEQFKRLIVKPFAEERLLEGETVLVTIDGLDECKGRSMQREIVFLINKFSLQYPYNPLIWIISSRPEPHISSAFSRPDVRMNYLGVEITVDSDQACSDVEHFLRDKFTEIKEMYPASFTPPAQQWPTEGQLTKVANYASGLFAFANTVVRFVEDVEYSNPVDQLQKVIDFLDLRLASRAQANPFAALDILCTHILSEIPPRAFSPTQELLLHMPPLHTFTITRNILATRQAGAYSAIRRLYSVIGVPTPEYAFLAYLKNITP